MRTTIEKRLDNDFLKWRQDGEQSARINDRLRELREQGVSGPEIPAILNREFRIQLPPAAYRARAMQLGVQWKGARATGDESARMNARLKELCLEGKTLAEIHATLNGQFNRTFSRDAYQHRAWNLGFRLKRSRPRPSSFRERVPAEQREACLQDPAWEARNGIADKTACRECFYLYTGPIDSHSHLKYSHQMDRRTYRERHPGARLFSFKQVAADTGRDLLELMTEFSEAYATPEERADATANGQEYYRRKDITTYTICCVDRCGFKAAELGRHLRNVHRISTREYWAKYGFLPTTTEASLARAREKDALRKKELEQLRAAAKGRPKAKRGRRQVPIENREYARVGAQVDKLIPNHLRHDKRAIQAARWEYYNNQTDLEYDTIAEYDRRYRQRQREKAQ